VSLAAAPSARSEPLVWVQLLGLGLFPLEALALLVLLAGGDPGPLPSLERLLCWSIGALAPAVLLGRRPADGWSLLLVQVPLRGRRPIQQRLSSLQPGLPAQRGSLVLACLLSLALLWWCDSHAAVATAFSPLAGSPRLVGLLLAALLLALMQWQWQQALQALWWLACSPQQVAAAAQMDPVTLERERLSLGIPLLLLGPLRGDPRPVAAPPSPPAAPGPPGSPEAAAAPPEAPPAPVSAPPDPVPVTKAPGIAAAAASAVPASAAADPIPGSAVTAGDPVACEEQEPVPAGQPASESAADHEATADLHPAVDLEPATELDAGADPNSADAPPWDSGADVAVAVDPEEAATGQQRSDLDQEIG
jgi:hypothetical protein